MGALSDESLVAGMASGDQSAAATLVRRYRARVYGLAVTIIGDRVLAEDVSQDAFVKAWRHAATYDSRRGTVATWLMTITRNAAIDAVRYRHDDPMDADLLVDLLTRRDEHAGEDAPDTGLWLRQALAELPRDQSTPIVMMTFYGLTAKEIAERDDVPLGTVKTRVRRGLQALRARLEVRDA